MLEDNDRMKSDIIGAAKAFQELLALSVLEVNKCPWFAQQEFDVFVLELESEVKEVLSAEADCSKIEEVGDVFRDALLALLLAIREGKLRSLEAIFEGIKERIVSRKPWLLEEREVTLQEAEKVWADVKEHERNSGKKPFCADSRESRLSR